MRRHALCGCAVLTGDAELDKHTAEKVGPDGRLLFNTGNICTHLYTIDFLVSSAALCCFAMSGSPRPDAQERSCTHYQGTHIVRRPYLFVFIVRVPAQDWLSMWPSKRSRTMITHRARRLCRPRRTASSLRCSCLVSGSYMFGRRRLRAAREDVFPLSKKLVALEVVREEEFLPLKVRRGDWCWPTCCLLARRTAMAPLTPTPRRAAMVSGRFVRSFAVAHGLPQAFRRFIASICVTRAPPSSARACAKSRRSCRTPAKTSTICAAVPSICRSTSRRNRLQSCD